MVFNQQYLIVHFFTVFQDVWNFIYNKKAKAFYALCAAGGILQSKDLGEDKAFHFALKNFNCFILIGTAVSNLHFPVSL